MLEFIGILRSMHRLIYICQVITIYKILPFIQLEQNKIQQLYSSLLEWSLKSNVLTVLCLCFNQQPLQICYIKFKITKQIKIQNTNKFIFAFANNTRQGFILSFYLFDLFNSLFIIFVRFNSFQYASNTILVKAKVVVDSKFIQMIVILDKFLGCTI